MILSSSQNDPIKNVNCMTRILYTTLHASKFLSEQIVAKSINIPYSFRPCMIFADISPWLVHLQGIVIFAKNSGDAVFLL